ENPDQAKRPRRARRCCRGPRPWAAQADQHLRSVHPGTGRFVVRHRRAARGGAGHAHSGDGMNGAELYQPRTIKRQRATRDEADQGRARLVALTEEKRPATVRQIFYAATVEGLVEKTEAGYAKVKTDLVLLRRSGAIPYHWLADNTRWQRKPETFKGLADA